MYSLYLLHWNEQEAKPLANELINLGYRVSYGPLDGKSLRQLREDPPELLVIDLHRNPSSGRDVAIFLRSHKTSRHVPIIFINGDHAKTEKIRDMLPDALYTDWQGIANTLKTAIDMPVMDPVKPKSVMAGYSGTPLPKKLGIKPGSVLTLLDPPPDFKSTLGELPENVVIQSPDGPAGDVTLWFVRSRALLDAGIADIAGKYGNSKLWLCWCKKSSGVKTDINGNDIRQAGLNNGLVDYKVGAINNTWSGHLFARKKEA